MATLADLEQARNEFAAQLTSSLSDIGPFRIAISLEGPDRPSAMILMFENAVDRERALPHLPAQFRPTCLDVLFDVVAAPAPPAPAEAAPQVTEPR